MSEANRWAKRALAHVRVLSRGIGPRGATSDEERRAAEYVRDELRQMGLQQARLEPFRGVVSAWLSWAVAFSLALWGALVGLLFARLMGEIIALAFYLPAVWIIYRELYPVVGSGVGGHFIRRRLWQGDSQNVVGVVTPAGPVERRVVLMGYVDSAHAPFFWRTSSRRRLIGCLALPLFFSVPCGAVTLILGVFSGNVWFYPLAILTIFLPSAGLVVSLRAGHSSFCPGANHNASGVGTLLALAERLKEAPLARTEVWLLATGCRETGGDGMRAFLGAHGETLAQATFVALEGVGVGQRPVYLTGEGFLWKTPYSPKALALAAQAAERCRETGLEVGTKRHRGAPTEMGLIVRAGLEGLAVNAWPGPDQESGVAGRRRMDDTFDTLEKEALAGVHAFVWALLQEIDADFQDRSLNPNASNLA